MFHSSQSLLAYILLNLIHFLPNLSSGSPTSTGQPKHYTHGRRLIIVSKSDRSAWSPVLSACSTAVLRSFVCQSLWAICSPRARAEMTDIMEEWPPMILLITSCSDISVPAMPVRLVVVPPPLRLRPPSLFCGVC